MISDERKEEARTILESPRGDYLIAEAFHYFCAHAPDSSNRDDMALILETMWPHYLALFRSRSAA